MIVVDAVVLAVALVDRGDDGDVARERLRGERLVAPELIDVEVQSVLRKAVLQRGLAVARAARALEDLSRTAMVRARHRPLARRCWELRGNVSTYDASYVALAERTRSVLVTADGRLARAPGLRCPVDLLPLGPRLV